MDIISAIRDKKLFSPWFQSPSWKPWLAFLKALFAVPLDKEEVEIFKRHTGRGTSPADAAREAWIVVGRRGGKSLIASVVALYLAAFRDYSTHLMPGERGTVMLIAADRRQCRVLMRYITGFIDNIPMLKSMVVHRTRESIELSNRIVLKSTAAISGCARIFGFACVRRNQFWRSDESSANPDQVLNGIRPAQ